MAQVIEHVTKPAINHYLCNKYDLSTDEILTCILDHFNKIKKNNTASLQYYYDNKDDPEYKNKLKNSRSNYYQNNKVKFRALAQARYENDPIYKAEYKKYQALYSQKKRNADAQQKRGRPRKYSQLEAN